MPEKIEICSIHRTVSDEQSVVSFGLSIKGNTHELTYKIKGEGVKEIPELCDAVVVTFLGYAIMYGLDFASEYPISEKLYYNLKKHVIPQLSITNKSSVHVTEMHMPLTKEQYEGAWVGTGISMGVDSFATIHEYMEDCPADSYKLTHLVHLKTGAHHGNLGYFDGPKEHELFLTENEKVKKYCAEHDYSLVTVESNLFGITNAEFGYNFDTTHAFRNLGCILLMQNHFNKYYYASAENLDRFKIGLNVSMAHYDKWLLPYISNDSLAFYSANESMTRIQKTKYIARFADTYDNLHVCWRATGNCGKCAKCIRTLVTLDILGELDKYDKAFDLPNYYASRDAHIAEILLLKNKDEEYGEIYRYMRQNKMPLPSMFKFIGVATKLVGMKIKDYGFNGFVRRVRNKFKR